MQYVPLTIGPGFPRSQRLMISGGYGRSGRPAQTLSRACTASRSDLSTWFNNDTETLHASRLSFAYLRVPSAAKAWLDIMLRSDPIAALSLRASTPLWPHCAVVPLPGKALSLRPEPQARLLPARLLLSVLLSWYPTLFSAPWDTLPSPLPCRRNFSLPPVEVI